MRISYNWLTEYVKLPKNITTNDLANLLTMAGLETESVSSINNDSIIELNVTPNRPDALSHMGIAREIAAILQLPLHFSTPSCKETALTTHEVAEVSIIAKEACYRYACRVIEEIEIVESPDWIKERLIACGIKPVNNIVDASNYVMLSRGYPTHAYDYDLIAREKGKALITVRYAKQEECFTTLDGSEVKLSENDLVVSDKEHILALAGIIGSKFSGIRNKTKTVLLEAGYFEPAIVRKMSKKYAISTESSYRFERGCDPNGVINALDEVSALILQTAGGRIRKQPIDVYHKKIFPQEVSFRRKKALELTALPEQEVTEVIIRNRFLALGLETIGPRGDALVFRIPTFRPDLTREIDLIEELIRLVGLEKIPLQSNFTKAESQLAVTDAKDDLVDKLSNVLKGFGFCEVLNYSFGSPQKLLSFQKSGPLKVINPLGEEFSELRQSLIPGLLGNAELNLRKGIEDIRIFELGEIFYSKSQNITPDFSSLHNITNQLDTFAQEESNLAGLLCGSIGMNSYDPKALAADFYTLKAILEECLRALGINVSLINSEITFESSNDIKYLHPGVQAKVSYKAFEQELPLGYIGELHPESLEYFGFDRPIYVFEINLDRLLKICNITRKYNPLPKYPAIKRDISLLLEEEVFINDLVAKMMLNDLSKIIESINVFDIYRGKGIPEGKKSVSFSLLMRSKDRTLVDEEVNSLMINIENILKESFNAKLR
jgi:phenylalanyl-tRNA synthetase beta chain